MKIFRDLEPVLTRDNRLFVLGILAWLLLTTVAVSITVFALMAFVSGAANAAPLDAREHEVNASTIVAVGVFLPEETPYREAIRDVEACLGSFPPGKIPLAVEADFRSESSRFCAAYESATNTIYINVDRSTGCADTRELLAHELVHAKGFDHHNDETLLGTHFDEHFVQMKKCGLTRKRYKFLPLPSFSRKENEPIESENRFIFEGGTSANHVKRIAVGVDAQLWGALNLGARIGAFNWLNIRVRDAWAPFGQLELGWTVSAGACYARAAQGVALTSETAHGGFASTFQFPTSIEVGLRSSTGFHLGLLGIHYSNGGTGQKGRVYNGVGVSLGWSI